MLGRSSADPRPARRGCFLAAIVEVELVAGGRGGAAETLAFLASRPGRRLVVSGRPRQVRAITAAMRPLSYRRYRDVVAWYRWHAAGLYGGAAESAVTR
jgi:hypothetical protein